MARSRAAWLLLQGLAAIPLLGLAAIPLQAAELTVISFGRADQAALSAAYYRPFTQATGVAIHAASYDGQTTELVQMVTSGAPVWDVMQVESRTLRQGCEQGLFERLDRARLPPGDRFIPGALSECGAGIFVWSQALIYADRFPVAPHNWADFWDLQRFPGKRGLRHSAKYTLEIALLADGVAPGEVYTLLATEAGVARAFRKLDQIRDQVIWWEAAAQPAAQFAAGNLAMSAGYTLWFDPAQQDQAHVRIAWQQPLYDIDSWAIPKGSPRRDDAYRFIAFSLQADRQQALSEQLAYGPTNRQAIAQLPASLGESLPSGAGHLDGGLRIDTDFWLAHGDLLERRFRAWAPELCRQQTDDDDDDYFEQPRCQEVNGALRVDDAGTAGAAHRFGKPGNPARVARTVEITMDDTMRFTPARIEVAQGETVRIRVHNQGRLRHEIVLGEADALRRHAELMKLMPEMQHGGPNMASVGPGESGELVWHFTRPGSFDFACLQPGHFEAGMRGEIAVQ